MYSVMQVFCTRLEQEHNANVVITAPSIEFRAVIKDNPSVLKRRFILLGHFQCFTVALIG